MIDQVKRLQLDGDHHVKLGIDKLPGGVQDVLDFNQTCSGIRNRSYGRAATLFANQGRYGFSDSLISSIPMSRIQSNLFLFQILV